jgi:formate-dependent nitrite reductase membrane component NrfD
VIRESATSPPEASSYYGRPILKQPVWKPEIPAYMFTGGLAGASALVAFGARNEVLARRAAWLNLAAIGVSPLLLISDLGRPERFLNMLRVFKPTSPMSVGTWILSASGAASTVAAASRAIGVLPRTGRAAEAAAAALGPFLSTYTAVLVADTAIPAWHEARRELPFVFAAGSAASAGGALAAVVPAADAAPARRLAILGGLGELAATTLMERRLGAPVGEAYSTGAAGTYARLAKALTVAGTGLMAVAGRRRAGAALAGSLLVGGAVAERWSVFRAGFQSANDPRHVVEPQRARLAAGGDA